MVNPANYDITIHQGATFEVPVQYKNSTGQPVDMRGFLVEGTIWNRTGTQKIADFFSQWIDASAGMFKLSIAASVTKTIEEQGQYDILITEPNGRKFYLLEGNVFWNPGLTGR
jgi:hypothetical protein